MSQNEELIELIKTRADIPKNLVKCIKITCDGICMFRMFYYYLYYNENQYNEIRIKIYNYAPITK